MDLATCPRCQLAVPIARGKSHVTATGAVELWHSSCWMLSSRPAPLATISAPPRPRVALGTFATVTCATALAVVAGQRAWAEHNEPVASLAAIDVAFDAPSQPQIEVAHEGLTPQPQSATLFEAAYPMPTRDGRPLDQIFPSLHDWTHPVTASSELVPTQAARLFASPRDLPTIRPECGLGHCGIDLDGPRGRPVVAVAAGTIVRVERHELGLDGRSGRFVKIEHDDGTLTAYMHLDDVREGLEVGDRVAGGELVGTLGATAVYAAPPHLHFSLEIPNRPGRHGDNVDTRYADPAPFLVRATVTARPERKHAVKPAT